MNFKINLAKEFINNPYMNNKTCGIPENTIKRQTSHILDTAHTHATEYNKKNRFELKNINTNNKSVIRKIGKMDTNVLLM